MKLQSTILASALLASGLAASPALAMGEQKPVVVTAQPEDVVPTRRVSYRDLNLANREGEKTLYHRVSKAVSDVCQESTGTNAFIFVTQSCKTHAWRGARPQMALAIQRAREIAMTGHSNIGLVAIQISVAP
jgi:UrcA family protein